MGQPINDCGGGNVEDDGDEWTGSSGVVGDNVNVNAKGWGGLGAKESVVALIVDDEDEVCLVDMVLVGASRVEMDEVELEFNGVWMSSSSSSVRSIRSTSLDGLMLSLGFLALWDVVAMVEDILKFLIDVWFVS